MMSKQPSPELLFSTITAFQNSAVIRGAIELDLFTAIAEGQQTPQALAKRCDASERGLRILCDHLVINGFLTKNNGQYGLTPDSAVFLDRRSPAYAGSIVDFMHSSLIMESFADIAGAVRRGGTIIPDEGTLSPENPVWVKFARAMMPVMMMPAQTMAKIADLDNDRHYRVLDIAVGHGIFGISFAQLSPQIEVTAVDWAPVLEVARENAEKFGVSKRYHTIAGSAFDVDWGQGYDIILLPNFLHHFDAETCERLLRKVHASLNDGGRAITLEFIPHGDRISPPMAASFAMTMLVSTTAGDAYTFVELERMFKNAGFSKSLLHEMPQLPEQIVVSDK